MSTEPWTTPEDAVDFGSSLFTGARVRLRPLADEDLATLTRWWNDERYMGLQGEVVRPQPDATRAEVLRLWSRNDTTGSVGFSVVDAASGELVGHVTLWGVDALARCGTLALQIGGPFVGRGYGTDAVRVLVRYAFTELGLHRVQLGVWSFNTRAVAAYERAGFVHEGRRREVVFHDGHWYDEVLLSIVEDEWWAGDDEDDRDRADDHEDDGEDDGGDPAGERAAP